MSATPSPGPVLPPVAILAGGFGTRLGPLAASRPKSLVEVSGEPFVAHQLRLLASQGASRVVLCTGHLGERIAEFVGDGRVFGLDVAFSPDGDEPLGTGGAIVKALPLLGPAFCVVYGDSYLPCDAAAAAFAFERCGRPALMTVHPSEGRKVRSNVELVGGRIVTYDKQAPTAGMRHVDYGLGFFRPEAFEGVPRGRFVDLENVYQRLLARGALACHEVAEPFFEVGSPAGLEELEAHLGAPRAGAAAGGEA
ncbi:MAG: NTP transferase domain-containing protein [Holophagales bacterium]|nr:NTP transferase domain-containing protein [Holophagales bacterium]